MRAASPTAAETAAYDKIKAALDKAIGYHNCYTDITKKLRASYEPSIATADGNVTGSIRFGWQDSMNYITAMHEIGHTVGVGSNEWGRMIRDGIFTRETATQKLRELDDDSAAQIHGAAQHSWPYGLNYTNEVKSDADLLAHCAMSCDPQPTSTADPPKSCTRVEAKSPARGLGVPSVLEPTEFGVANSADSEHHS